MPAALITDCSAPKIVEGEVRCGLQN